MYETEPIKLKTSAVSASDNGAGTLSTLLEALQPFPEARVAIIEAFRRKLGLETPKA